MKRISLITGLLVGLTAGMTAASPQDVGATQKGSDNTKVNKRDRSKAEPTADQARETKSDREIMQDIRKAVVADKSLSTYGHNVKIISQHGKVTLKGPVHSEEESKTIEAKATDVAGTGNVSNQLSVKADNPPKGNK